ncbi:DUF2911 domain-containing protein [Nostoc ellipsosporum NOK]|jgi:hypothetical protein|nr:DUF2911 domain-containing protein [Nostoc ellipsosporum NOK]
MRSFLLTALAIVSTLVVSAQDQDKSKRPSPPASVRQVLAGGAEVTIDYSQPSVKGRTIGKDLEPKSGEVWRTGANEATTFDVTKDVKVEGKTLPAGKYSLFTIAGDKEWTIIFNKTWNQWGAYKYKQADDALRVKVKPGKSAQFTEKMTFTIDEKGTVTLWWGNLQVPFKVQG